MAIALWQMNAVTGALGVGVGEGLLSNFGYRQLVVLPGTERSHKSHTYLFQITHFENYLESLTGAKCNALVLTMSWHPALQAYYTHA